MHLPRAGQPSRPVPVSPHLRFHFIIRMRGKWVERKKLSLLVRGRKTEQPQRVTSSSSSSSFLSIFSLGIEKFYRNCCSLTHKPQRHQLNIWELIVLITDLDYTRYLSTPTSSKELQMRRKHLLPFLIFALFFFFSVSGKIHKTTGWRHQAGSPSP